MYVFFFILNKIVVLSNNVIFVSIWFVILKSGYNVLILLSGFIIFWYKKYFYFNIYNVVVIIFVNVEFVFLNGLYICFKIFWIINWLICVLVLIVVKINRVLKRIVKWY